MPIALYRFVTFAELEAKRLISKRGPAPKQQIMSVANELAHNRMIGNRNTSVRRIARGHQCVSGGDRQRAVQYSHMIEQVLREEQQFHAQMPPTSLAQMGPTSLASRPGAPGVRHDAALAHLDGQRAAAADAAAKLNAADAAAKRNAADAAAKLASKPPSAEATECPKPRPASSTASTAGAGAGAGVDAGMDAATATRIEHPKSCAPMAVPP